MSEGVTILCQWLVSSSVINTITNNILVPVKGVVVVALVGGVDPEPAFRRQDHHWVRRGGAEYALQ